MVALLYVAHALPLYFFNVALPAILRHQGVDIRVIGMLSLLYLPWAFKFLWASYVDNYYCAKIGKRKTWLFFYSNYRGSRAVWAWLFTVF
nr:hypothetical protein [Neisseria sp. HMSC070F02]